MSPIIIETLRKNYEAQVQSHKLNINIMILNPTSIPEHEDFISAVDRELSKLVEAHDKLQALKEYF